MSNLYKMEELAGMKRSELQKLAKQHGIKANMKTDGLIKALATVSDSNAEVSQIVSSVQEVTTSSTSSTEDQSEIETCEEKPKGRRGRGRKQNAVKQKKSSPVKAAMTDVNASGDSVGFTTCSEPDSENQTEDEKMSPVAKKSKAKPKGRGRGRKGRQTKEEEQVEEKQEVVVPVASVVVSPPAVAGRRSRSLQRTPVVDKPTLPTPPTSGSSRNIKRAIRRATHTPEPAASSLPTPPSALTSDATSSINKKSSRSASKVSVKATPKATPSPSKTPVEAKTRGSTGKRSASGSAGGKAKRVRRGTFDKSPEKGAAVEVKSSSTLKDEIMAEIDRKVQLHVAKSKSGIPTKAPGMKKTPNKKNWSKSHHGALDKMESIDDYLERKQKRAEALSASKKHRIPVVTKPAQKGKALNFASPKSVTKAQNFASPKPTKASMPGNPKSAKTVSFKVSKLKTPKKVTLPSGIPAPAVDKRKATPGVRKSISVLTPGSGVRKSVGGVTPGNDRKSFGGTRTPSRKSVGGVGRKSLGATKTPSRKSFGAVTPFGKTAIATSATKPKNVFDLKASLSKPLTYKPHTGKLKPFGETLQNNANVRAPSNLSAAKTLIKKPQLKGREARRAGNAKHRAQMRNNSFMANRGITGC